jgi:hypothetical protein
VIETLKRQTDPETIIFHSRTQEIIKQQIQANQHQIEQVALQTFKFENAKDKLEQLNCFNSTMQKTAIDAHLQLYQNRESVGCCGAILSYLQKIDLDLNVISLELFHMYFSINTSDDYMYINEDTLFALSVFDQTTHPNIHSENHGQASSLFGNIF